MIRSSPFALLRAIRRDMLEFNDAMILSSTSITAIVYLKSDPSQKTFTGTILAKLVRDGKVDLDKPNQRDFAVALESECS